MTIKQTDAIGAIVANNLHAASVFNAYSIDYYTKGERTLEHACLEENAPILNVMEDLQDVPFEDANASDFNRMDVAALSAYILRTHHKFTENRLVFIRNTLQRLVTFYAGSQPNVIQVQRMFDELSVYLTVHMKHEEFIVFPYIQKMIKGKKPGDSSAAARERPISAMRDDHNHEVQALRNLCRATDNYTPPRNGDYAFKVAYSAMRELADDLKIHMHLENNILFPQATRKTKELSKVPLN